MKTILLLLTISSTVVGGADPAWEYLDNGRIRLGMNTNAAACIGFFAESKTGRNLLNHYDEGRYLQQSWYGQRDGSLWNQKPWVWNPVQGGSWRGRPAKLLHFEKSKTNSYAKGHPRHWAAGDLLTNVVMETWVELEDSVAEIRFRMTYRGKTKHPRKSQEMPAVFIDYALPSLVYYRGKQPWTGGALHRVIPTWPNQYDELPENWAAYLDENDWGIGVYSPGFDRMTFYRHPGKTGPKGGGCSYFAPITKLAITPGFQHEYRVYLTIGQLDEIRFRFRKIRDRNLSSDK